MSRHGSSRRYSSLSKRIKTHGFRGPTHTFNHISSAKQAERLQKAKVSRDADIQGSSIPSSSVHSRNHPCLGLSTQDRALVDQMLYDYGVISEDDNIPFALPPGEEAFDLSYEGGEHEAFAGLAREVENLTGRCVDVLLLLRFLINAIH